MPNVNITCCFTGHRASKLPWGRDETDPRCLELKKQIYDAVESVYYSGVRHYICGMANGCDLYFGEAVMALKRKFRDITLEAAIPYAGQADHWAPEDRSRWQQICDASTYVTVVSNSYNRYCMQQRNQYMVDNAGVLIAAYNGSPGGTLNTMLYAIRTQREVIQISIDRY